MEELRKILKEKLGEHKKSLQIADKRLQDIRRAKAQIMAQEQQEVRNIDTINGAIYAINDVLNPSKEPKRSVKKEVSSNGKKKAKNSKKEGA